MNPITIGLVRHGVQLGAGALGVTALSSGTGLELAVAAVVSAVNFGWFVRDTLKANRKAR